MDRQILSMLGEAGKSALHFSRGKNGSPQGRKLLFALGLAFLAVCAAESLIALAKAYRAAR